MHLFLSHLSSFHIVWWLCRKLVLLSFLSEISSGEKKLLCGLYMLLKTRGEMANTSMPFLYYNILNTHATHKNKIMNLLIKYAFLKYTSWKSVKVKMLTTAKLVSGSDFPLKLQNDKLTSGHFRLDDLPINN